MSYQSRILSLSPILYLPLTETSGTTFADLTGNGHTGTGDGNTHAGGADGPIHLEKAAQYGPGNATTTFAVFADLPNGGAAWTCEVWMKQGTSSRSAWSFLPKGSGAVDFFLLQINSGPSDSRSLAFLSNTGVGQEKIFSSFETDHLLCWHYWAITWDGVTIAAYRDGVDIGYTQDVNSDPTWIPTWSPTSATLGTITTGVTTTTYANHFAAYNYALSPTQIAGNYAAASPRQDGPCFGIYRQTYQAQILD